MASKVPSGFLLLVAVLCAFTWHMSQADPFIPLGSDPSGGGDEAALFGQSTGFAWRSVSLLYFYVVVPDKTMPNDTSLYVTKKAIFFPLVDKIAKLTIPNTYAEYAQDSSIPENTFMYASGFGLNSTSVNYIKRQGATTFAVGSWSLVIEMDKGNVTGLKWIDGCGECKCAEESTPQAGQSLTCPQSTCISNNCGINNADCLRKGVNTCDMKIFLAWVGTDSRGRPCTSAGSLPYNFLQFGLTPAYRAAAGVDDQYLFNISSIGKSKPTTAT